MCLFQFWFPQYHPSFSFKSDFLTPLPSLPSFFFFFNLSKLPLEQWLEFQVYVILCSALSALEYPESQQSHLSYTFLTMAVTPPSLTKWPILYM